MYNITYNYKILFYFFMKTAGHKHYYMTSLNEPKDTWLLLLGLVGFHHKQIHNRVMVLSALIVISFPILYDRQHKQLR